MPIKLLIDTPEFAVVTTNMDAMRDFYEHILGLEYQSKLEFAGGYMHRYQFGSSVLKLVAYDTAPTQTAIGGEMKAATGYRYCSLVVSNLKEIIAEVAAAGLSTSEITEFGDGIAFAFVQDPDGNNIEFAGTL
ncbi:VOC family protein [Oceanicoccus sp. KOV_DT_Chl]|uniref:VOC family protein n=1 Tax=Oceanicoccus sp. KOV_DT_Chl TaxID=1904639 RepID=UPI000C79C22F|nr:VOC family protein [Oceanicoccus sp. KOV_DT_Chl]